MPNQTATCVKCGKQYLIIEQEQKFLNDKGLPMPSNCPSCRQMRRLKLRGDRQLYRTKCQQCQKDIVVSFDPSKVTNKILCKSDFEKYYEENDSLITDPLPEI